MKEWETGRLLLALLCLVLFSVLNRVRGIFSLLFPVLVFTLYVMFGTVFIIFRLFQPISLPPTVPELLPYLMWLLTVLLSAMALFYLLTSESLNLYLGTEVIFPIRGGKTMEARKEAAVEKGRIGEERERLVTDELRDAVSSFEKGEYAATVKYSADVLRSKLLEKFGLDKSLTSDEVVEKLPEIRGVDIGLLHYLELIGYVLSLGEKCASSGYEPSKEEAETIIKYTNGTLLALSLR